MIELSLLIDVLGLVAVSYGIWYLCVTVKQGFSEHIKAMQAIYDLMSEKERSDLAPPPKTDPPPRAN